MVDEQVQNYPLYQYQYINTFTITNEPAYYAQWYAANYFHISTGRDI